MKSSISTNEPLHKPLRYWAFHLGVSVSSLSKWMKRDGYEIAGRKDKPGATLREVLGCAPYWLWARR